MTVSREVESEIRVLYFGEHLPVGTVAAQLGVHEDVVRRVVGLLEPRAPADPRPLKVDPVKEFIAETLKQYPRLCSTRLFDMVKSRGYTGTPRTLRAYVRTVRPRPKREAFLRLSPLIGEQAQVDWAHVGNIPVPGGVRPLWLFVMALAWSRAIWAEFVLDLSVWSLLRSLTRACAYFGGTPREWLFDNAKVVVLERHGAAARFHPLLLDLAGHHAVRLKLCGVRKGNEKGVVERHIRYVRDRFLAARCIHGIDQGNREFLSFVDEVAHPRPHPTLPGRTVLDCFEEERGRLLPLPKVAFVTEQVIPVRVDKTAFCRFDTNVYSVAPSLVGKTITLAVDDREVRLLDGSELVASHQRCWGRRQILESPEHREAILALKQEALASKGRSRLQAAVPGIDGLYERWVHAGRNLGSMTTRTLKLLDLYGPALLASAAAEILERGLHDPGALAALCEQRRHAMSAAVPLHTTLSPDINGRDVIPHDLEAYDAKSRRRD